MLFHEIYSSYFSAVSSIFAEAVNGTLTEQKLTDIVQEKAFNESILTIPQSLKGGTWPLLTEDLDTPLMNFPSQPLTTLQKRWLKALLSDPRIRLFSPSMEGLEDVEPLYSPDVFVYFDRYTDGDPYEDEIYISHFRTILQALREKRKLNIQYRGYRGKIGTWTYIPYHLEYSSKDDKFRLQVASPRFAHTLNLSRMLSCELAEPYAEKEYRPHVHPKEQLVLELTDERNALERIMLHFSHLEKETVRLDEKHYRLTLYYEKDDETELLIRVLSFGPMVRVISPESILKQLKFRLEKQMQLRTP